MKAQTHTRKKNPEIRSRRSLAPKLPEVITIEFEDHHQDFLEWDIHVATKRVMTSRHQGWMWEGVAVITPLESLVAGSFITIRHHRTGDITTIKYPITRVSDASDVTNQPLTANH